MRREEEKALLNKSYHREAYRAYRDHKPERPRELEKYEEYYPLPKGPAQKPMSNFEAALWMVGSLVTFILLLVVLMVLSVWIFGYQTTYELTPMYAILIVGLLASTA